MGHSLYIPKKIHYCWFGENKLPKQLITYMDTWRKIMPDYEIVCWDESNFDVNSTAFTSEAFRAKKWAFVSDYARLCALYDEGGIYLDTDVIVKKPFDDFLNDDFFSAIEFHPKIIVHECTLELLNDDGSIKNKDALYEEIPGIGILAAIMGAKPKHPFVKDCLEYYHHRHFILPSGEYDTKVNPAIYAKIALKYGFRYTDSLQKLKNMTFYPSTILAGEPNQLTEETYALHYSENSWLNKTILQKIKQNLRKNNLLRMLLRKNRVC